jgi:transmembrane sensor
MVSDPRIKKEAIDWFVDLLDSSDIHVRERFCRWLKRSPQHVCAGLYITRASSIIERSAQRTSPEALIEAARAHLARTEYQSTQATHRPFRTRILLVAALAAITVAILYFSIPPTLQAQIVSTVRGEQRWIYFSDGSAAQLNTDTQVELSNTTTPQYVRLIRGEARFRVLPHRKLPFAVHTPDALILTEGAELNVQFLHDRTAVTTFNGSVAIQARRAKNAAHIILTSGQRAALTSDARIRRDTGPSLEHAMAWPRLEVVFQHERLADAITEINRYQEQPLLIRNSELSNLPISGTFSVDDLESFISYAQDQGRNTDVLYSPDGTTTIFKIAQSGKSSESATR